MPTDWLHILQHSLGVDQYGRGRQYRNHYVTGEGCDGFAECREMVKAGLMTEHPVSPISGGMPTFCVTDAGRAYMAGNSPNPPKLTRSQQRYEAFLTEDCGMRFGEWLKSGANDARR